MTAWKNVDGGGASFASSALDLDPEGDAEGEEEEEDDEEEDEEAGEAVPPAALAIRHVERYAAAPAPATFAREGSGAREAAANAAAGAAARRPGRAVRGAANAMAPVPSSTTHGRGRSNENASDVCSDGDSRGQIALTDTKGNAGELDVTPDARTRIVPWLDEGSGGLPVAMRWDGSRRAGDETSGHGQGSGLWLWGETYGNGRAARWGACGCRHALVWPQRRQRTGGLPQHSTMARSCQS